MLLVLSPDPNNPGDAQAYLEDHPHLIGKKLLVWCASLSRQTCVEQPAARNGKN
jgi:hypothetical protein